MFREYRKGNIDQFIAQKLEGILHLETHRSNQYSETNVMHFLFNLLRIKGLYMFRALLAHPHEVRNKTALGVLRASYVSRMHQLHQLT
jgi:hypothetical protein